MPIVIGRLNHFGDSVLSNSSFQAIVFKNSILQALNVTVKLYYVFRLGIVNENLYKFNLSKFNSLQSRFNLLNIYFEPKYNTPLH